MGELDIIDGFVYHLSFSDSYPTVISRHHSCYCIILFIIIRLGVLFFKAQDPDCQIIAVILDQGSIDIQYCKFSCLFYMVLLHYETERFHYGNNPCHRAA